MGRKWTTLIFAYYWVAGFGRLWLLARCSPAIICLDNLAVFGTVLIDWDLDDAKNRFRKVVNLALTDGPQKIRRRKDTVILISAAEYERLAGKRMSFTEYSMNGPSLEGLDLERDQSPMRDVEL